MFCEPPSKAVYGVRKGFVCDCPVAFIISDRRLRVERIGSIRCYSRQMVNDIGSKLITPVGNLSLFCRHVLGLLPFASIVFLEYKF